MKGAGPVDSGPASLCSAIALGDICVPKGLCATVLTPKDVERGADWANWKEAQVPRYNLVLD
jgi:hypothetical protein